MNNHMPNDALESSKLRDLLVQISDDNSSNLLEDLMVLGDRPEVLALLVYKLADERAKTNQLLSELNKKYDSLLEKVSQPHPPTISHTTLSSSDKAIVDLAKENGKISAGEIKDKLNYKGLNAASQRLNILNKQGILKKVRDGQKVYFLPA